MRLQNSPQIDHALRAVIGMSEEELYHARKNNGHIPDALFNTFLGIIKNSGVEELIGQWRAEDHPSPRGRKEIVPPIAIMMAIMLNSFRGDGYSYEAVGYTVARRFSPAQAQILGYDPTQGKLHNWYHRAWASFHRLQHLIDGWYLSRQDRIKDGYEHHLARLNHDPERAKRGDDLADRLLESSIHLLPKKYLSTYRGDAVLDSTPIPVLGSVNPNNYKNGKLKPGTPRPMRNIDDQIGRYVHDDDHDGADKTGAIPAYELDTTVMNDSRNGDFPFTLITAIRLHRPAELKDGPREAVLRHVLIFGKRCILSCDRAFNQLGIWNFQIPLKQAGVEMVYDYKKNNLGPQGHVPGKPVIIVDCSPYVNRMPENYIMISRWHAQGKIDPDTGESYTAQTRDEIIKNREVYRMKPKGLPDQDGFQRFTYPNPRNYIAFDPATGELTTDHLQAA